MSRCVPLKRIGVLRGLHWSVVFGQGSDSDRNSWVADSRPNGWRHFGYVKLVRQSLTVPKTHVPTNKAPRNWKINTLLITPSLLRSALRRTETLAAALSRCETARSVVSPFTEMVVHVSTSMQRNDDVDLLHPKQPLGFT